MRFHFGTGKIPRFFRKELAFILQTPALMNSPIANAPLRIHHKPKVRMQLVTEGHDGQPFLILSVRDAIAREVADFLDLVPAKEEALHLLLGAVDRGFRIYDDRIARESR